MAGEPHSSGWLAGLIHELKDMRISPRVSLSVALIGTIFSVLTWAPDWLGIRSAIQSWRPWAILAAIGGAVLFVIEMVAGALESRRAAHRKRAREAGHEKTAVENARRNTEQAAADKAAKIRFLEGMTIGERGVCHSFIVSNLRTQTMYPQSEVMELTRRGVLIQISSVPRSWDSHHDYTIADWAWDYLHEHRELLDPSRATGMVKR